MSRTKKLKPFTGAEWDKLVADIAPSHFFDLVASATA